MKRLTLAALVCLAACSGDDDIQSLPRLITLDPDGPSTPTDVRGRIVFPERTDEPVLVALTYFSNEDPQTVVVRVAPGDGVDYEVPGLYRTGSFGAGVDLNGNGEFDAGEWVGYAGGSSPGDATSVRPSLEETVVELDIPLVVLAQCLTNLGDACTESIACRYTTCFCSQNGFMRLGGKCEGRVCSGLTTEECTDYCQTSEPLEPVQGPCYSWMDAKED